MSEKTATTRFVEATTLLNALCADLAGDLVTLSAQDRKASLRPPANATDLLRGMADALRRLPRVSAFLGQDLDAQEASFEQLLALDSTIRSAQYLVQALEDTRTSLRIGQWDNGLLIYGTCQTLSKRDPAYAVVVQAMAPAFKRTRKDAKAKEDKSKDKAKTEGKTEGKTNEKTNEKPAETEVPAASK